MVLFWGQSNRDVQLTTQHRVPRQKWLEISKVNRNYSNNHSSVPFSLAVAQNAYMLFTSTKTESLG
jgi:hypothetical protein